MSDNYRVIRTAQKAISDLVYIEKWSVNQVVKEIGVSHSMVNEMLTQDAVTVKIRDVSVDKLRIFVDKFEAGIEKPVRKGKVNISKPKDEFSMPVPESMADAIPEEKGIDKDPTGTENLLAELSDLAVRFSRQGYRLDVVCTLNHPLV